MDKKSDIPALSVIFVAVTIISFIATILGFIFGRIILGVLGIIIALVSAILSLFIDKKAKDKRKTQDKTTNNSSGLKEKNIQKEISTQKQSESLKKIIKSYTKIPLDSMVQLLEFTDTIELQKWIMDLPEELALTIDGTDVLIPASLKNDQSISKMTDNIDRYFHTCYYCAEPLEDGTETCPNCTKEILKCMVCKLDINFGDTIGKCSLCEAVGHLAHLQEWLKVNGKCPHCQQQLPLEGIVLIEPEGVKKKK